MLFACISCTRHMHWEVRLAKPKAREMLQSHPPHPCSPSLPHYPADMLQHSDSGHPKHEGSEWPHVLDATTSLVSWQSSEEGWKEMPLNPYETRMCCLCFMFGVYPKLCFMYFMQCQVRLPGSIQWSATECGCSSLSNVRSNRDKFKGWEARVSALALALAWLKNLNELNGSWLQTLDSKPCIAELQSIYKDTPKEGVEMINHFAVHTHLKP